MALNAYLQLKGKKTGDIRGSVTQKGREGKILVIASSHGITVPVVAAAPAGRAMHKPFVITKELDKSSPLLYNLLVTNEEITDWTLQFWTPKIGAATGAGTEVQHFTVKLINARITDIQFHQPNNRIPDTAKLAEYEEVSFIYDKIEWTWTDGGITTSADNPAF